MDSRDASIAELRAVLQAARGRMLTSLLKALGDDPRAGARKLALDYLARSERQKQEKERLRRLMAHESALTSQGYRLIAGVDEVGRGALAGPLVAGAVILPTTAEIVGINDSKKLTARRREELVLEIKKTAVAWAIAEAPSEEIDKRGLQAANLAVLSRAVEALEPPPDFVICDGFKLAGGCAAPSMALVKGDSLSQTVAAASILAKVHRDALMVAADGAYPAYGFQINKGYGTVEHMRAVMDVGPCALHRCSFYPVSEYVSSQMSLDV